MKNEPNKNNGNAIFWTRPLHRVIFSIILSACIFLLTKQYHFSKPIMLILIWDSFSLCYIIATWIIILSQDSRQLKIRAQREDGSRLFVFFVIIVAAVASMVIVMLNIIAKDKSHQSIYLPASIAGMLLSWIIVHTTFTIHYAHLYYGVASTDTKKHAEGLAFPEEKNPDLIDFAYFSFVIGMTFQVSDVAITSRLIRRVALFHALVSFYLNTFVVALTVNLIAGL